MRSRRSQRPSVMTRPAVAAPLRCCLVPGGIWIVGRTVEEQPPEHRASILERTAGGFRLLERYGGPSEIEDLALALRV